MRCPVCVTPTTEPVCKECRRDLADRLEIAAEQIVGQSVKPTGAGLVDLWGRVHRLDARSLIGRDLGGESGVAITAPSISRNHARLSSDDTAWTIEDLGSSNGTFIEDRRVEEAQTIQSGDRLRFGQVSFYFLEQADAFPTEIVVDSETVRVGSVASTALLDPSQRWSVYELHEPSGGGGGIIQVDGKRIQLTLAQVELVVLLADRMEAEYEQPAETRGFIPVSELLGKISLEVAMPRDANVRQLIRRVRRAFDKVGLGDLIESRYGHGYRIRLLKARR